MERATIDLDVPFIDPAGSKCPSGSESAPEALPPNPVRVVIMLVLKQGILDGARCVSFRFNTRTSLIDVFEWIPASSEAPAYAASRVALVGSDDSATKEHPGGITSIGDSAVLRQDWLDHVRMACQQAPAHEWFEMHSIPVVLWSAINDEIFTVTSPSITPTLREASAVCCGGTFVLYIERLPSTEIRVFVKSS